jgi:hypothetical protein
MIAVVSSDGGVTFIPDPPPAIPRSLIDSVINTLAGIESSGEIQRRFYRQTLDWLHAHKFYLTEADCTMLNAVIARLDERLWRADPDMPRILRGPFQPDPAMIPELYYLHE